MFVWRKASCRIMTSLQWIEEKGELEKIKLKKCLNAKGRIFSLEKSLAEGGVNSAQVMLVEWSAWFCRKARDQDGWKEVKDNLSFFFFFLFKKRAISSRVILGNPLESWWAWIAQETRGTIKKSKLECKIFFYTGLPHGGYLLSRTLLLVQVKSWQEWIYHKIFLNHTI